MCKHIQMNIHMNGSGKPFLCGRTRRSLRERLAHTACTNVGHGNIWEKLTQDRAEKMQT